MPKLESSKSKRTPLKDFSYYFSLIKELELAAGIVARRDEGYHSHLGVHNAEERLSCARRNLLYELTKNQTSNIQRVRRSKSKHS